VYALMYPTVYSVVVASITGSVAAAAADGPVIVVDVGATVSATEKVLPPSYPPAPLVAPSSANSPVVAVNDGTPSPLASLALAANISITAAPPSITGGSTTATANSAGAEQAFSVRMQFTV
jgi:hypothetical protein